MKRYTFILYLAFFAPISSWAQSTDAEPKKCEIFVGLLLSGNQSWLTGDNYAGPGSYAGMKTEADTGYKFGYKLGLTVSYELSKRFSLESSPAYVFEQSNHRVEIGATNDNITTSFTDFRPMFSWLELPAIVNYAFVRTKKLSVYLGSGIAIRKLIKSEMKVTTTLGNGFSVSGTFDGLANDWNLFPTIQLGGNFRLSDISRLTVLMSYQRSLSRLYKTPDRSPDLAVFDPDYAQNSFALSIGYSVNVKSLK